MHKREDIQNQNHPAVGHTHEESSETKKLKIHPSTNWLGQKIGTWGSGTSASPMGVTFGSKIQNLRGNHILLAFCILSRKKFC